MSDSWVSLFFSRRDLKDLFFEWLRCPRAQNGISSIGVSEVGPRSKNLLIRSFPKCRWISARTSSSTIPRIPPLCLISVFLLIQVGSKKHTHRVLEFELRRGEVSPEFPTPDPTFVHHEEDKHPWQRSPCFSCDQNILHKVCNEHVRREEGVLGALVGSKSRLSDSYRLKDLLNSNRTHSSASDEGLRQRFPPPLRHPRLSFFPSAP